MKITITLNHSQLCVINSLMAHLDTITIESQPRNLKGIVSICLELRETLLQKAVKTRHNPKDFKLKLPYYKADALLRYLEQFYIFFEMGIYEKNVWHMVVNDLHQKLQ